MDTSLIHTDEDALHVLEPVAQLEEESARTRRVSKSWRDAMSPNEFSHWVNAWHWKDIATREIPQQVSDWSVLETSSAFGTCRSS